jgi:SAM-dependent methyltransferase
MAAATHRELILDQFTRQAGPFNAAPTTTNERMLGMIVAAARPSPSDTVLDVACGGGIIACAFAPLVRQVTGIDMTPAMLVQARHLAAEKHLANVSFEPGDATALPYPDGAFRITVSRFSFHHFPDPLSVLHEMQRVTAPGGRVVVVDMYASEDAAKAAEWNRLEQLRDPSHVRALSFSELKSLYAAARLPEPVATRVESSDLVDTLLARSFPNPGDDRIIRDMFAGSLLDDRLGIPVRQSTEGLRYAHLVAILSAEKPGA